MEHKIKTVRVYDIGPETNGYRILVDRLWPRGLRKEALEPFVWAKEIAPTNELRKWFGHDPVRFREFARKYQEELESNPYADGLVKKIRDLLKDRDVLLMFAAKNREMNHASVLKKWLEERLDCG